LEIAPTPGEDRDWKSLPHRVKIAIGNRSHTIQVAPTPFKSLPHSGGDRGFCGENDEFPAVLQIVRVAALRTLYTFQYIG
jgi:hypothetical protein